MTLSSLITWPYRILYIVIIFFVLLATQWGLDLVVWTVNQTASEQLQIKGARGKILGPITIEMVRLKAGYSTLQAKDVTFQWQPLQALKGRVHIDKLSAKLLQLYGFHDHLPLTLYKVQAQGMVQRGAFSLHATVPVQPVGIASTFDLNGSVKDYHVVWDMQYENLHVVWAGQGNQQQMKLNADFRHFVQGDSQASVQVDFGSSMSWKVIADIDGLQPEDMTLMAVKNLHFKLFAGGNASQYKVKLKALSGERDQKHFYGDVVVNHYLSQWDGHVNFSFAQANIHIKGLLNQKWQGEWLVDIPVLSEFYQRAKGSFYSEGQIGGSQEKPTIKLSAHADNVIWHDQYALEHMDTLASYKLGVTAPLSVTLNVHAANIMENDIPQLGLMIRGDIAKHDVQLDAILNGLPIVAHWQGGWVDEVWSGILSSLSSNVFSEGWKLVKPAKFMISSTQSAFDPICLQSPKVTGKLCVDLESTGGKTWRLTVLAQSLGLDPLFQAALSANSRFRRLRAIADGKLVLHGYRLHLSEVIGSMKIYNITGILSDLFSWSGHSIDSSITQGKLWLTGEGRALQLKGQLKNKTGGLMLSGTLALRYVPVLRLHVEGDHYQLGVQPNLNVTLTPKVDLELKDSNMVLSGSVLFNKANINPISYVSVVGMPDNVIFVGQRKSHIIHTHISPALDLVFGDPINFDISGLQGKLSGKLRLQSDTEVQNRVLASGMLMIKNGMYSMYGKLIPINTGKLIYTDRSLNDPEFDFRIVRTTDHLNTGSLLEAYANKQTLGMVITGDKDDMHFTLFSEPDKLSDLEILTVLLTGSDNETDSGRRKMLNNLALSGYLGNNKIMGVLGIMNQIQRGLLLDQLTISLPDNWDQSISDELGATVVTLGKSITDKIFMRYQFGLSNDFYRFSADYKLAQYLALRGYVQADSRGIDMIYSR